MACPSSGSVWTGYLQHPSWPAECASTFCFGGQTRDQAPRARSQLRETDTFFKERAPTRSSRRNPPLHVCIENEPKHGGSP